MAQARVYSFRVPEKHLFDSGGRWAKFAEGVDPHMAILRALRSGATIERNSEKSFKIVRKKVTDLFFFNRLFLKNKSVTFLELQSDPTRKTAQSQVSL